MKKFALAFAIILAICAPSFAANYVEAARTAASEGTTAYVDIDSIQSRENYAVALVKWVPEGKELDEMREELKMPIANYYIALSAFSKEENKHQLLEFTVYSAEDQVVYQEKHEFNPERYEDVPAGSINESIRSFILKNVK